MSRRQARELALQALFQLDFNQCQESEKEKQQEARLSPPPRPEPPRDCPPPCDPREDREPPECGRHEPEKDCGDCDGCRAKENKNPLTCLFEALRGRKKAGFDADDFLLIGLIALLMGKEGNEDIVLILALLLLV